MITIRYRSTKNHGADPARQAGQSHFRFARTFQGRGGERRSERSPETNASGREERESASSRQTRIRPVDSCREGGLVRPRKKKTLTLVRVDVCVPGKPPASQPRKGKLPRWLTCIRVARTRWWTAPERIRAARERGIGESEATRLRRSHCCLGLCGLVDASR